MTHTSLAPPSPSAPALPTEPRLVQAEPQRGVQCHQPHPPGLLLPGSEGQAGVRGHSAVPHSAHAARRQELLQVRLVGAAHVIAPSTTYAPGHGRLVLMKRNGSADGASAAWCVAVVAGLRRHTCAGLPMAPRYWCIPTPMWTPRASPTTAPRVQHIHTHSSLHITVYRSVFVCIYVRVHRRRIKRLHIF